ncbi:hypothetical protein BC567DRAFT_18884 [Phyllosticta citribraziliensis]
MAKGPCSVHVLVCYVLDHLGFSECLGSGSLVLQAHCRKLLGAPCSGCVPCASAPTCSFSHDIRLIRNANGARGKDCSSPAWTVRDDRKRPSCRRQGRFKACPLSATIPQIMVHCGARLQLRGVVNKMLLCSSNASRFMAQSTHPCESTKMCSSRQLT